MNENQHELLDVVHLYFSKAVLPVLNSNSESASHDTA